MLIVVIILSFCTSLHALSLGIDFGTSGVRGCLIDANFHIQQESRISWGKQSCSCFDANDAATQSELKADCPKSWKTALGRLISSVPKEQRDLIDRICISGTSSSALIYDTAEKKQSRMTRMYNFNILDSSNYADDKSGKDWIPTAKSVMKTISMYAPPGSSTIASSSTLAKLLMWHFQQPLSSTEKLAHQADYCANLLVENSEFFTSDWHNALKLGYDVETLEYPQWLMALLFSIGVNMQTLLPNVIEPGRPIGFVSESASSGLGLKPSCTVVAGTTDSIAAFIASGATQVGEAVTSLGSTLAVKAISENSVQDSGRGIYSHRLGNQWLVGGASNVGCAILRQEQFSDSELAELSSLIDPNVDSPLTYYPLCKAGERFPVNDPLKPPVLEPKPMLAGTGEDETVDRTAYLHGILQGIANVEKDAYNALANLGASTVTQIYTAGGGSKNAMWSDMRSRLIGIKVEKAANVDAAYGAARLAAKYEGEGEDKEVEVEP